MQIILMPLTLDLLKYLLELAEIIWSTIESNIEGRIFLYGFQMEDVFSQLGINFTAVSNVISLFGMGFLILKFVKKIGDVYALQTDGDPNGDIFVLITSFCKAFVVSMCFGLIWGWICEILYDFYNRLISAVGAGVITGAEEVTNQYNLLTTVTAEYFWNSIYLFLSGILMLTLIKDGIEFWLLRLGIPLAGCGMLDANGGVYNQYMRLFLKAILTIIIKAFLLNVGFAIVKNGDGYVAIRAIIGISTIILAFGTPKILSELLVPHNGGSRAAQYISTAFYMVRGMI